MVTIDNVKARLDTLRAQKKQNTVTFEKIQAPITTEINNLLAIKKDLEAQAKEAKAKAKGDPKSKPKPKAKGKVNAKAKVALTAEELADLPVSEQVHIQKAALDAQFKQEKTILKTQIQKNKNDH